MMVPAEEMKNYIGEEVGVSDWLEITQDRINQFAEGTNDHQFIHVDPEMAKSTPWGSTIAHGFLTLSLLSYLSADNTVMPENMQMAINYGLDKVHRVRELKIQHGGSKLLGFLFEAPTFEQFFEGFEQEFGGCY